MGSAVSNHGYVRHVLLILFMFTSMTVQGQGTSCSCNPYGCKFDGVCRPQAANCGERNVALGKAANVSSLYKSSSENSGPACLAVNGNTDTTFRHIKQNNPNCVHTAVPDLNPFWEVDLGREFLISRITVYGREENGRNVLRNSTIMVDDKLCYTFSSDKKPDVVINTTCMTMLRGRRVKVQKKTSNDEFQFICLCELQVWVNCSVNGFYGESCTECGHCAGGIACDVRTGRCPQGCDSGWRDYTCELECASGSYGPDCRHSCGNCSSGTTGCNSISGKCPGGCKPGYQSQFCNESCTAGRFGDGCNKTCGFCENKICDPVTGYCPDGCDAGWQGEMCNNPCPAGTYGKDCAESCGDCRTNTTCRHTDGRCQQGCAGDYTDELCKTAVLPEEEGKIPLTAAVSSIVVVLILIIAAITVAVVVMRRGKAKRQTSSTGVRSTSIPNERRKQIEEQLTFDALTSSKINSEKLCTKIPSKGDNPGSRLVSDPVYYNTRTDILRASASDLDTLAELEEDDSDATYRNEESVYATFMSATPKLDNLQRHLVDTLASGTLLTQFADLPKGLTDEHQAATLPVNIKKNRFNSVLPYNKTRVLLTDGFFDGTATDFINASYIAGFLHEKTYIAAQGPRDNTAGDFWRMVWQEKITQVVMLTGLIEGGKSKCFEYWPACDQTETYGPVTVTGVDVQRRASFFVRSFVIQMRGTDQKRKVEQYHYLDWPDHGVPTTTSLLNFWRFAKARAPQRPPPPVLVHCTAGVGRTGTYIGLDIGFGHAISRKEVNIQEIVQRMRKERCIMVQAPEQYVFLHKAVLEAYTGRDSRIHIDQFEKIFPLQINADKGNAHIDREFQTVMQMRSLAAEMPAAIAQQDENITKIRNRRALPADEHLVYLTSRMAGRNDFVNAVFMSTYHEHHGNILTQLPLQDTLVDFWRLVDDNEVQTIVSLGYENEHIAVHDYCQYWPKDDGTVLKIKPYIIKNKVTSSMGDSLTSYLLNFEKDGVSSREVQLLCFKDWAGELPGNTTELLQIFDLLESRRHNEKHYKPVVIQCLDGVSRTGLFCALCNVVSRLTSDREIDVYMAVRELHSVIPQAVTSLVQYRFCYHVAQHRFYETNVYANA